MNLGVVITICSLVIVILLLTTLLHFEKTIIKEVFQQNDSLKRSLFNLIEDEERRHERILENKATFNEKCLYDLVKRVEIVEKKLDGKPVKEKKLDVYIPHSGKEDE